MICSITVSSFAQQANQQLIKKAKRIHEKALTIDSHIDTPMDLMDTGYDIGKRHDPYKDFSKVDLPRMKEGGQDGAFFAVFTTQGKRDAAGHADAYTKANITFDSIYAMLSRYHELAEIALTPADAYRIEKAGKRAVFIGMENGYPLGHDLSRIYSYYLKGARYITLVHTKNNDICTSSTDTTEKGGLSPFGYKVVEEMNRVGMMIDISHASDQSFYDVIRTSRVPVIASHSCARAICNNPRNLNDDMLRALAKNGGVVQMCILSAYVKTPEPNPARDSARKVLRTKYHGFEGLSKDEWNNARKEWSDLDRLYPQKLATVSDVCDHIDHMVKIAGIDHVGIGTDFDGGGGVEGCFDVTQMGNITLELVKRGYSEKDIRKIWGGNLMRVMKKTDKVAQKYKLSCRCNT